MRVCVRVYVRGETASTPKAGMMSGCYDHTSYCRKNKQNRSRIRREGEREEKGRERTRRIEQ